MTKANRMLRDALRTIETRAADALAHQPDDDALCRAHLIRALRAVTDTAADTVFKVYEMDRDFTAPRRGVPEAQKPPRQETGPSPANLEGTR